MNIEDVREYCITKKGVTEGFPFGDDTLVFKVGDKVFLLANLEGELRINLKNEPEKNMELREQFPAIIPGYHMNKQHWNTLIMDGSLPISLVKKLIDESYKIIVDKLPQRIQQNLK